MAQLDQESDWILKSQKGDHESFEKLITQYQKMIHSLTYRMTGSLAEAEDLAQETFIQAYYKIGSFRKESRFSSWIYRIAINTSLNWKKKKEQHDRLHQDWAANEEVSTSSNDGLAKKVQEALLKLNPKQRTAIILTTFDGLNHAEAARASGCSETTISWRIFAARKKLKQILLQTTKNEASLQNLVGVLL